MSSFTIEMAQYSNMSHKSRRAMAYEYLADRSAASVDFLRNYWSEEPAAEVDGRGNTLIHLIVICGNEEALEAVIGLVEIQDLRKQNVRGETALHEAARRGHVNISKILLHTEMQLLVSSSTGYVNLEEIELGGLVSIKNKMGETALYLSAAFGEREVFQLLEEYHSDCYTERDDHCNVLHAAIMGEYYHMAILLFGKYPQLGQKPNKRGNTALNLLASSPSSFRSGSTYAFGNLGRKPFIPLQMIVVLIYYFIWPLYDVHSAKDPVPPEIKRNKMVQKILDFPWFKPIDDAKQKHILALALARKLIQQEADWSCYAYTECIGDQQNPEKLTRKKNNTSDPLIQAIEKGIPELVEEILIQCPDSANCIDEKGRNILHTAAEYKSINIYELLKKHVLNKERMLAEVDYEGNTILHQTTNIKPAVTNIALGIANMMSWEVYWFERIRRDCSPHVRLLPNKNGDTAEQLLLINSAEQRKAAEKAMKDINGNLMIVAALIGTISFAALFTVPGSYNQKYGYPLLLESDKRGVELFLGYDATTVFASAFALGNLLSIQLSRFTVDDFYIAVPLKYLVAISAMFYSACFTVATSLQAFILQESLPTYYLLFVICVAIIMVLGYVDAAYFVFYYVVEVFEYSFKYKTQRR